MVIVAAKSMMKMVICNLPIHVACSTRGISASVICKLLVSCPSTCFTRSEFDGEIPLELLLSQGSHGLQIFNSILKDLPRSCFIDEEKGTSTFHEVCTHCIPESIMIQILELYPEIALFQDSAHGNSIAHMICSNRHGTATMLRAVLAINQNLASIQDNYGNLPLHVVNSEQDIEEMIQMLLAVYPQGIMSLNEAMETPYSSKIRASPTKISALLNYSDPILRVVSLSTRNTAGMLPIEVSLYHMQHYLSLKCHNSRIEITSDALKSIHQKDTYLQNMVSSIMSLLNATCDNANGQYSQHHASFWLSYPLITKLMIQQYPQLLTQHDSNGNLPLHILAKADTMIGQRSRRITCTGCNEEINSGVFFLSLQAYHHHHHHHCSRCNYRWKKERIVTMQVQLPLIGYQEREIFKDVLISNPSAIKTVNSKGDLPLHLSLRAGKSWFEDGVKDLIDMAPETISSRDKDGSPPVMIAAYNNCDLSSIYSLLRKNPDSCF